MSSRRIYITLNSNKEKDKIIEEYLSNSYSESDAIKEALYRLAINSIQLTQIVPNSPQKVQTKSKRSNTTQKGDKTKRSSKVQLGAENTEVIENVVSSGEMLQTSTVRDKEGDKDDKLSRLQQNELEELSKFI